MLEDMDKDLDGRLTARFGELADFAYDEETETNMRVRADVDAMDRIVSIGFPDPSLVAN